MDGFVAGHSCKEHDLSNCGALDTAKSIKHWLGLADLLSQSCRSGQEYLKDSTLLVTKGSAAVEKGGHRTSSGTGGYCTAARILRQWISFCYVGPECLLGLREGKPSGGCYPLQVYNTVTQDSSFKLERRCT